MRRCPTPLRMLLPLIVLAGFAASADPAPLPWARGWLTGGGALRNLSQSTDGETDVVVQGLAPTALHLSGAWYFKPWLGAALEGRAEVFWAVAQSNGQRVGLTGVSLQPLATFRWQANSILSLDGQAGWSIATRPVIALTDTGPQGRSAFHTGPVLGAVVSLDPSPAFAAQVFARLEVAPLGSALGHDLNGFGLSVGAQLRIASLKLSRVTLGVGLTYELSLFGTTGRLDTLAQTQHRVGLGVALEGRDEAPVAVAAATGSVAGRVVRTGGAPVGGASVSASGKTVVTSADGRFELAVPPGKLEVRASAKGLKPASRVVHVTAGARSDVQLELQAPSGPGRIRGVVRSAPPASGPPDAKGAPLKGVHVVAEGKPRVEADSNADGEFVLDGVGPGPVTVKASLAGFVDGDEAVQVPPEAEASLELVLSPKGVKAKATVRGLVRSAGGAAVKATIRIQELKLKLSAKADGRFVAEIPGGHYTLVIEAPGYVTQTKVLDVADGDQALFHADLERAR